MDTKETSGWVWFKDSDLIIRDGCKYRDGMNVVDGGWNWTVVTRLKGGCQL